MSAQTGQIESFQNHMLDYATNQASAPNRDRFDFVVLSLHGKP
jgi:hypothetical protein